jgi:hypothetical protein
VTQLFFPPVSGHESGSEILPFDRLRLQLSAAFDEQEEHAGAEAEQHHGKAGGDTPESADGRATIIAAADDDVARHGDKQFEDAAAQKPARGAFEERAGIVRSGGTVENKRPDDPKDNDGENHRCERAGAGIVVLAVLAGTGLEQCEEIKMIKGLVGDDGAKDGKNSGEDEIGQKEGVTMTGILSGRRTGNRRSAMLIGSSSSICPVTSMTS